MRDKRNLVRKDEKQIFPEGVYFYLFLSSGGNAYDKNGGKPYF